MFVIIFVAIFLKTTFALFNGILNIFLQKNHTSVDSISLFICENSRLEFTCIITDIKTKKNMGQNFSYKKLLFIHLRTSSINIGEWMHLRRGGTVNVDFLLARFPSPSRVGRLYCPEIRLFDVCTSEARREQPLISCEVRISTSWLRGYLSGNALMNLRYDAECKVCFAFLWGESIIYYSYHGSTSPRTKIL